jgi:hypothetical protein
MGRNDKVKEVISEAQERRSSHKPAEERMGRVIPGPSYICPMRAVTAYIVAAMCHSRPHAVAQPGTFVPAKT